MKKLLLSLLASLALTGGAFAQVFPSLFLAQMNGSGGAVRPAPASGGSASFSSITDTGLTAGRVVYTGTGGLLSANDQFTYDGTSTVAIGSTITNGLQLYNTVDQVTNYERFEEKFSANELLLQTANGGTGTLRSIRVRVGGGSQFLIQANATPIFSFNGQSSGVAGLTFVNVGNNQTSTATSGTNIALSITPTYNQASGNAANTDLYINRTQTAVGSGAQLLADFQVGGASNLTVGSTIYGALPSGATTLGTLLSAPARTFTVTGTNTATAFQGNYFGAPTFTNASVGTITDAFNTVYAGPAVAAGSQVITRAHTFGILDSTSAVSSITGSFVVANAFGTAGTSVGIGAGNVMAGNLVAGASLRATSNGAAGTPIINFSNNTTSGFWISGNDVMVSVNAVQVADFGASTLTLAGSLTTSQTAGIIGTTTNNSANAGSVGEELKTTVASGSAVSLTTATSTNLASVSLTAGDWDVYSEFIYIPGATTSVSQLSQGISQSTGALPTTTTGAGDYSVYSIVAAVLGANNISQSVGPVRVSLSGTTTVFAVARPTFTISTLTVYGSIRARRVR